MNPLDQPIPLPTGRNRADEIETRLVKIRSQVASKQLLARMAGYPEWPDMRKLAASLVGQMEEDLLGADEPRDMYRIQGGILALSAFLEAPDKASERISKYAEEMEALEDELEKLTRP